MCGTLLTKELHHAQCSRYEGKKKGRMEQRKICVFRGSTNFKASGITCITGKGEKKRESMDCRSSFLLKYSVQLNTFAFY